MNLIGETQHPEKFVPLCIKKILRDEKVIIHGINDGAGQWTIGARKWIHARNQADALLYLLKLQVKEGTTRAAAGTRTEKPFISPEKSAAILKSPSSSPRPSIKS